MAGEDYVSPINGKTYRVPKYEEPADAPVAFKDFADNLPPGGIDFEPDRIGQVVQSLDGAEWDKGMSLNVVDAVPADDDAGYAIGDVVFVTGPGDGGSSLPGVGGGKVLQVVRETDPNKSVTNNSDWEDAGISLSITPKKSDSTILLQHIGIYQLSQPDQWIETRITDSNGAGISGATRVQFGAPGDKQMTAPCAMFAYVAPATTNPVTYKVQFKVATGVGIVSIRNDLNPGQLYATEVSA